MTTGVGNALGDECIAVPSLQPGEVLKVWHLYRMPHSSMSRRQQVERLRDDGADAEVPAAVVCVNCGRGDCPGCVMEACDSESGVMAIVPWESTNGTWGSRLLDTVQATTFGAEAFFGMLKDGSVKPAFRFALATEALAVGSTALFVVPAVLMAIPGLLLRCFLYASTRHAVAVSVVGGVLAFTALLLGAHAFYGLILRQGASRSLALRFSFYACGWDFGSSPAGLFAVALRDGISRVFPMFFAALQAPACGTDSALAGLFATPPSHRDRVRRRAMLATLAMVVPTILAALIVIGAVAFAVS